MAKTHLSELREYLPDLTDQFGYAFGISRRIVSVS
jgi:hypothetical protein